MKVVFHVNELEKWSTVVGNINNLLKADAKMKAIEIVANGEAVKGYLQADLTTPSFMLICLLLKSFTSSFIKIGFI